MSLISASVIFVLAAAHWSWEGAPVSQDTSLLTKSDRLVLPLQHARAQMPAPQVQRASAVPVQSSGTEKNICLVDSKYALEDAGLAVCFKSAVGVDVPEFWRRFSRAVDLATLRDADQLYDIRNGFVMTIGGPGSVTQAPQMPRAELDKQLAMLQKCYFRVQQSRQRDGSFAVNTCTAI